MTKTETTTQLTPQYLRGKTKDEIIDVVMMSLDENDRLRWLLKEGVVHAKYAHGLSSLTSVKSTPNVMNALTDFIARAQGELGE